MRGYPPDRRADALLVLGLVGWLLALTLKDAPMPALHAVAGFCLGISIPLLLGSLWLRRKMSARSLRPLCDA